MLQNASVQRSLKVLGWILGAVLSALLIRNTVSQGQDFEVYWRAAQSMFVGENPYDLAKYGAMVHKYPPWSTMLFLPLGILSMATAKVVWALLQLGSLYALCFWVYSRARVRLGIVFGVALAFWGIWAVHFLDAQVSLIVLALSLFLLSSESVVAQALSGYFLSFKVFPLLALASVFQFKKTTTWLLCWVGVAGVSAIPLLYYYHGNVAQILEMIPQWMVAADSGDQLFGLEKTLGRDNQGLPALLIKTLGLTKIVAALIAAFAATCLQLFLQKKAKLQTHEKIAMWLSWTTVIHPLAWFHSFVYVFPLACLVSEKAWVLQKKWTWFAAILSIAAVVAITQKTLGAVGEYLEFFSIKAFGVIALNVVFTRLSMKATLDRAGERV